MYIHEGDETDDPQVAASRRTGVRALASLGMVNEQHPNEAGGESDAAVQTQEL